MSANLSVDCDYGIRVDTALARGLENETTAAQSGKSRATVEETWMGGWVSPRDGRINVYARYVARVGYGIFPVAANKVPPAGTAPKHQFRQPTAEAVRELLSFHAGYGVLVRPGIVLLDPENERALRMLERFGLPRTVRVRTPGGGYHLPYCDPGGTLRGQQGLLPEVDLIANEGSPWFAVGPGSCRNGLPYEIIDGEDLLTSGDLPVVPAWVGIVRGAGRSPTTPRLTRPERRAQPDRLVEIAAAFTHTGKGTRHEKLRNLAVSLRAAGADRDELDRRCVEAAEQKCDPPLTHPAERKEVQRIISWVVQKVPIRRHPTGGILDAAVRHAMAQRVPANANDDYTRFLGIVGFFGQLPDPVFPLVQTLIANRLGVGQYRVSRLIMRAVKQGALLREVNHYRIKERAKLYRLPARVGEPRPARIVGVGGPDTQPVRVVFDAIHWCYSVVPLPDARPAQEGSGLHTTSESSPENLGEATVDRPALLAAGLVVPTADEIQAYRMAMPYAGPNSDFVAATLGDLRARRQPARVAVGTQACAAAQPPPAKASKSTTKKAASGALKVQPAPKPPRRWESGIRDPVDEVFKLYDTTQPHTPPHEWAWPELADHVRIVCDVSLVRDDLVEILKRLRDFIDRLGPGAYVDRALALAIDVIVKHVVAGRTELWRRHQDLCERMASGLREHVPRPKRVVTDWGFRTESVARPSLHHALAVLLAGELLSIAEIRGIVARRQEREQRCPPRRACRRDPAGKDARKRTLEQYRMVLALEQLASYRVRDARAREARLVIYRELMRARMITAGFERLGHVYQLSGQGRRLKMPVEHAVWLLMQNGAGWGLNIVSGCTSVAAAAA